MIIHRPCVVIRLSAFAMALALLVVGAVSDGIVRHIVQTIPLWVIVMCGARPWLKWFAIPPFVVWLAVMIVIWLFLLGIARLFSGHFSPIEIAMTIVVGAGAMTGVISVFRQRSGVGPLVAAAVLAVSAAVQIGLFTLSFRSTIANDTAFMRWVHAVLISRP
jgi:hypothetical protein